MQGTISPKWIAHTRNAVITGIAFFVIGGCASTATTSGQATRTARIEIQQQVGFTITEEARISSDARLEYDQALTLLKQGRFDEGISRLEHVVADSPALAAPRIDLGIAHHRHGDLEAAMTELLVALEANPDHPIANNELGIVYRKLGRFADARRYYEAALATYPKYHFARRNLAVLCDLYLADLDCALRNYEAYMATVPGDDEASMWIADLRNRLGQERQ